jgi:hypothetical protein
VVEESLEERKLEKAQMINGGFVSYQLW